MSLILGKCENEIIQFAVTYLKRTLSYSIVSQYFHDLIVNKRVSVHHSWSLADTTS